MIHYRGHNQLLMKNEDVGIFNKLYIVENDGTNVNVADIVVDPSILDSLEQRVDTNDADICFSQTSRQWDEHRLGTTNRQE